MHVNYVFFILKKMIDRFQIVNFIALIDYYIIF